LILAETIDRMVERDDLLRAAVGMPDRHQNTGTQLRFSSLRLMLYMMLPCGFAFAPLLVTLCSVLVPYVYWPCSHFVYLVFLSILKH